MTDQLRRAISAGGVVYRYGSSDVEVVLCGRRRDGLWTLPKGTPEEGESLERTALREVEEETGLAVAIEQRVGSVRYRFTAPGGVRYDKRVDHHLMVPVGGRLADHDHEFDVVSWNTVEEAFRLLTFPNDRAILRRAVHMIPEQK